MKKTDLNFQISVRTLYGYGRIYVCLFICFLFSGCISKEVASDIDINGHRQIQASLENNIHTMSSPYSGLRATRQGSSSCSACAH